MPYQSMPCRPLLHPARRGPDRPSSGRSVRHNLAVVLLFFSLYPRPETAQAADPFAGPGASELYSNHCQVCHGADGRGVMPETPDLATSAALLSQSDITLLQTIKTGKGVMPAFNGILTERQILDVVTYMRKFSR